MAQTYGCTPHMPESISDSEGVSPSLSKYISLVFEERGRLSRQDIFFSLFARHYLCHYPKPTMTSQCFSILLGLNTGTPNHNCFFCYFVFSKLLMRQNTLYSSLKTFLRTLSISKCDSGPWRNIMRSSTLSLLWTTSFWQTRASSWWLFWWFRAWEHSVSEFTLWP